MQGLAARIPSPQIIVMCADERRRRGSLPQPLRQGTRNTLEAFPGTPLIFCSSTAVYGITDGRWITEEHNVYPSSVKNGLLIRAEQAVLAAGGTVVRLGALYGPDRCVLVSQYFTKGTALPGAMDRWLNYIHRDDAAAALHLLCTLREPPAGIYNLTDRTPMQMGEIYSYLSICWGNPLRSLNRSRRKRAGASPTRGFPAPGLMALGWEPLYPSFADGVHNVLEALEE